MQQRHLLELCQLFSEFHLQSVALTVFPFQMLDGANASVKKISMINTSVLPVIISWLKKLREHLIVMVQHKSGEPQDYQSANLGNISESISALMLSKLTKVPKHDNMWRPHTNTPFLFLSSYVF